MSGHSHWSTIKRQKKAEDVKRGKIFSKLSKAISVAAREGSDPDFNPALRSAIDEARSHNMPKSNIEKAVGKAGETEALKEAVYEGYGPGGVAFMVRVLTDNKNRTLSEVRKIIESHGGKLGEAGSVAYVFNQSSGEPTFTVPVSDPEQAKRVLDLANALDEHNDVQRVYANFDVPQELLAKMEVKSQ